MVKGTLCKVEYEQLREREKSNIKRKKEVKK